MDVTDSLAKFSSSDKTPGGEIWREIGVDDLDRPRTLETASAMSVAREQRIFKRSRLERYIDILKVVDEFGPIRRTHILYKANLSWGDLEDSLCRLEQAGALQKAVSKNGVHYDITEAGQKFLANIMTVRQLLEPSQSERLVDPHRIRG